MPEPLRLNLGAGDGILPGYVSIDIRDGKNAFDLSEYADESAVEVRASHILEHAHYGGTGVTCPKCNERTEIPGVGTVLQEWVRVLKPGGLIKIAVPDLAWICSQFLAGKDENT